MASIVRSGARRLAGSALLQRATAAGALVQRTQASGLDARRLPFAARFMMSGTGQQARAQPESLAKAEALEKIQLKKEELYFLISLTETNIHTNLYNRQLLQSLSAEIKPRPRDDEWHLLLASKRRSDVIRPVGIVVGLCIGAYSVLLIRGSDAQRLDEISDSYQGTAASHGCKEEGAGSKGEGGGCKEEGGGSKGEGAGCKDEGGGSKGKGRCCLG